MSIFERFVKRTAGANSEKKGDILKTNLIKQLQSSITEDKLTYPEAAEQIDAFVPLLQEAIKRHVDDRLMNVNGQEAPDQEPMDAATKCYLSPDRMIVYACILPPLDSGKDMEFDAFLEDMRYEGVTHGIDKEIITTMIQRKKYLHIFPAACGTSPIDGEDGEITDLFERRQAVSLESQEGVNFDFSRNNLVQVIRKGEIICRIKLPTPGKDGRDVTGQILRCKTGNQVEIPMGENTKLSNDGQLLLAAIDGAISMEDGKFCVKQQKILIGDVDASAGKIHCLGDLYIGGNVSGGATVEASGSIVINGQVFDAHITSTSGSIWIQNGVKGEHKATLKATRQIHSLIIESTTVVADGDIYADVIVNSDITTGGSVYVIGGRGLILGGQIKAHDSVSAKKIGNLSNQINEITVGYCPGLNADIQRVMQELDAIRETIEKLRKNVTAMRAAGELLSLEKRALLAQLMEQRTLYSEKEEALNKELKTLKQKLHTSNSGKVLCDELYPITKIRIGDKAAEIRTADTNCNIHIYAGRITVK